MNFKRVHNLRTEKTRKHKVSILSSSSNSSNNSNSNSNNNNNNNDNNKNNNDNNKNNNDNNNESDMGRLRSSKSDPAPFPDCLRTPIRDGQYFLTAQLTTHPVSGLAQR